MIHFCKPKKSSFFSNNKGFSIIEAIVGITLAALLLVAFTSLITQTIKINQANMSKLKATMYLQELIEIAKDMEQSATPTIIFNTGYFCDTCHPEVDNSVSPPKWELFPGTEPLENNLFTRWITIEDTGNDDIKMATAKISWKDTTSTLETYLYYYGQ